MSIGITQLIILIIIGILLFGNLPKILKDVGSGIVALKKEVSSPASAKGLLRKDGETVKESVDSDNALENSESKDLHPTAKLNKQSGTNTSIPTAPTRPSGSKS